ncbi:MAG: deoxyuridine 5'-triphosphate nucleotidohydrolase [Acetatifactor sp.]|nr:deoxyuridine 5'-triphosphate nucleotidohydrolase [Acetatifactor sp.]
MNRIAQFEKVSFEQFLKDYNDTFDYGQSDEEIKKIWEDIKLPTRATIGSAGYDFITPIDFILEAGQKIKIPTGIRCRIDADWVLKLYPRSGLGFKYHLQLINTVGIIDSDYYNSDNEGHISVKITNDSNEKKSVVIKKGNGFIQGIFVPYGITTDDEANGVRNGGFGSTRK